MSFQPNPFSVTDLLNDDFFLRWMKERRQEDRSFWEEWLLVHPEKREIYEDAVATFLVIEGKNNPISDDEVAQKTEQILALIPDEPENNIQPLLSWTWIRWVAALIIIGLGTWYQFQTKPSNIVLTTRNEEKSLQAGEWALISNNTQQPVVVLLPDNSSVVLSQGSSLRFWKKENGTKRQVFLQGEGFFEVAKNPKKPFFVYTNNLTTKVLGTSFQVRAFADEAVTFVKVKSGKVAVTSVSSPAKPTLLTEHQQLSIESKTYEVSRQVPLSVKENPLEIVNHPFTYEFTSVPDVLEQLKVAYNISIEYEKEKLQSCTFTGQLNDVPFVEKIRLICLTIESTYEIVDNKVIIHSRGCN